MQPLPSGLPSTIPFPPPPPPENSTAPPPPPPPRLPIAAFTSAASNASLNPPSRRRPTLHIIVVLGSATVPVLRHAHHALSSLSAKGVHVFLQTETERPGSASVAPITPDVVSDVVAACRADFVVLIADRNLHSRTVQLRLSPTAEFVDVPLSDLSEAVLAAWTQQLRTVPDRLQRISLAFNPNVVTAAHLDPLLQAYSGVPAIRKSYANLARLANITQSWVHSSEFDNKPQKEASVVKETPTAREPPASPKLSPSSKERDASSSLPETMTLRALHNGLHDISRNLQEHQATDPEQVLKSDITFCWLKRSESISARMLRSQLKACDLHRNLTKAVDVISNLPIASSSLAPFNGVHVPSEVHRQRLLREINDILPRIEELGQRLSKRPKTRRRRRLFHAANPWMSYANQISSQREGNDAPRVKESREDDLRTPLWRCFACRTLNEAQLRVCEVCKTGNHTLNTTSQTATSDAFQKRLREALKNTTSLPSPWIFAPGAVPIQPPINAAPRNGMLRHEHGKQETNANAYITDDPLRHGIVDAPFGSPPLHDIKQPNIPQYDLGSAMQTLSVDDEYNDFTPDKKHSSKLVGDQRGTYRQPSPRPNHSRQSPPLSASKAAVSPVRLASSAPNGRAPVEFASHRLSNGTQNISSPQSSILQQRISHSLSYVHSSHDQDQAQAGASSMLVGSFPGSSMLSGNLSYDLGAGSSHGDLHQHDLFRPDDVAPSGVPVDYSVPSKTGISTAMEELAVGSYEAAEPRNRLPGNGRRIISNPIAVPGSLGSDEATHNEITSLQALAAASDAANGGIGSATQESLRAVSAVVTPIRNQSGKQTRTNDVPNGTYNMF